MLVAFFWSKRPVRYAVALGGIMLVGTIHGGLTGNTVHKERDFFGVLKVRRDPTDCKGCNICQQKCHAAIDFMAVSPYAVGVKV